MIRPSKKKRFSVSFRLPHNKKKVEILTWLGAPLKKNNYLVGLSLSAMREWEGPPTVRPLPKEKMWRNHTKKRNFFLLGKSI